MRSISSKGLAKGERVDYYRGGYCESTTGSDPTTDTHKGPHTTPLHPCPYGIISAFIV